MGKVNWCWPALLPAERAGQSDPDEVGLFGVNVVVEAPYHHLMARAEVHFEFVDGIVCEALDAVAIVPESGLMGDDEIQAGGLRPLE